MSSEERSTQPPRGRSGPTGGGAQPSRTPDEESAQPPGTQSRAGRNLPAAIGIGAALGALVICVLVFAPKGWIAVESVALGIAMWEVTKRLRQGGIEVPFVPLFVGGEAMIWLGWPYGLTAVLDTFAATVLVMMFWRLLRGGPGAKPENYSRDIAMAILVAAWLPLFASFGVLMVLDADHGAGRVLCLMIGVVCSDIGGYTAGVLFGKHPMVPAISPKKSWEGFAGSLVFCVVGGILSVTFLVDAAPWIGAVLGVVLVLTATLGDLVESQIKRDLGIKDMGTLLPGHGGIMDRLDSALPSAVATYLVLGALV